MMMRKKDFCRCCLSERAYKDMANEYIYRGTSEVYSTIFADTFNVHVSNMGSRCLICEGCISRLREAAAFKIQVLETEQSIFKMATIMNAVDPRTELKMEDDDFDDTVSDFSDSDFEWGSETKDTDAKIFAIKLEDKIKNTTSNIAVHHRTSDNCLINTINSSLKTAEETESKISLLNKTKVKSTTPNEVTTKVIDKVQSSNKKISTPKLTKTSNYDIDRRKNTLKLLLNSNMCMFTSHRVKYGCYACKHTFINITSLREHTKIHSNITNITSKIKKMRGLSYKNVDISDLKCQKCDAQCGDLVDLQHHLTTSHQIDFASVDHYLIPYRLTDELRCVICRQLFNTFTRLSIHMNVHYANNVCELCGLSFVNRTSLRMHHLAQHAVKNCKICGVSFTRISAKKTHMRAIHKIDRSTTRHCVLCKKTFRYTYMLEEHKVHEHNYKKPPPLQCQQCDKTFLNRINLRIHERGVHLKEREHPCGVCGMRFFTKFDRNRHERTHDDVKRFSCSYCDVKFKCKDSCRRHLKRQHRHLLQA